MAMAQIAAPKEYLKELEFYTKKVGLTPDEKRDILALSMELGISPKRIIATIATNATLDKDKKGNISESTINQYSLSIEVYKKGRAKCLRETKEREKETKGGKGFFEGLKEKVKSDFTEKPEDYEKKIKMCENIITILKTFKDKGGLIEKIKEKSGIYRTGELD
jgi:hypothetical protein